MNVDLDKPEIEMLDAALVAWTQAPIHDGFFTAMLGGIIPTGKGDRQAENRREIEDARAAVRQRELQVMRLRLKLMEAAARPGEFEAPTKPTP